MPRVSGCGLKQRAQAFVAMLVPANPRQAQLKKELAAITADMIPGFTNSRAALKAFEELVLQLDNHPACTQPQAPVVAHPTPAPVAPFQAGTTIIPAQTAPQAEAPAPEQPIQPQRKRREETPTRCLGLSTVLCDGGVSEAQPEAEEETLPWAERS
jgi:hypothetical protein